MMCASLRNVTAREKRHDQFVADLAQIAGGHQRCDRSRASLALSREPMKLAIDPGVVHAIIANDDARVAFKHVATKRGGNPRLSLPVRGKAQTIAKPTVVTVKLLHLRSVGQKCVCLGLLCRQAEAYNQIVNLSSTFECPR